MEFDTLKDTPKIKEIALERITAVKGLKTRYFLGAVRLESEPRIKVFRGFRGVGKTTGLLQLLTNNTDKAIYISLDHPYVSQFALYDVCNQLIKTGYKTILIDEVHYYKNWQQDTKAIYDDFSSVNLVLSGSAPLAFEPERRYEIIDVEPMSVREFSEFRGEKINATESWSDINKTLEFLTSNSWIYKDYSAYIKAGAFPICFRYFGDNEDADIKNINKSIYNSILKSIRNDAPFFAKVDADTVRAMERCLILIANSPMGEFSINNLSKHLEISKNKSYEIISILESMKILRLVRPYGKGAKLVTGEPKLMFYHPNLRWAVCDAIKLNPDVGAIREELAVFCFFQRGWKVNTIKGMKRSPDYIIEKGKERIITEIGGPSKGYSQLAEFKEKKLVINDKQLITLALF